MTKPTYNIKLASSQALYLQCGYSSKTEAERDLFNFAETLLEPAETASGEIHYLKHGRIETIVNHDISKDVLTTLRGYNLNIKQAKNREEAQKLQENAKDFIRRNYSKKPDTEKALIDFFMGGLR